jgi:peptidoglycan/xylan/chitin deacetylase (PgdA/CDA1 family)
MSATVHRLARRSRIIALLPLSMIPFLLLVLLLGFGAPSNSVRAHGGGEPWAAPRVTLSAAALALRPPPTYTGQIPVLLYHGVGYRKDLYTVTPTELATQLALLGRLGYHTISTGQYLAWREGESVALPSRPILITFDDGDFDSYRGADQILAEYHMRATIFVIVSAVQGGNPFYLTWSELQRMQRSGRWDVEFHAYNGHVRVPYDAAGDLGAFYAVREYRDGRLETVAQYAARVSGDIDTGLRIMVEHGFHDLRAMAMPYGEYGQKSSSDPVKRELAEILDRRFVAVFVQSVHDYTPYSSRVGPEERYEVHDNTTLAQLYGYLNGANPGTIAAEQRACAPGHFRVSPYEGPTCSRWRTPQTPAKPTTTTPAASPVLVTARLDASLNRGPSDFMKRM